MTVSSPAPKTALPQYATGLAIIGTVDFNKPLEWAFIGGLILDFFFVSGISKWVIAAGIIAARYELEVKQ